MPGVQSLIDRLTFGLDADGANDTPMQAERRLLAHLLLYHYREDKPKWWHFFALRETPLEDLYDERDVLAGLVRDTSHEPKPVNRSLHYRFTFPPQEFKLDDGRAMDMTTGERHYIVSVDDDHVVLTRSKDRPPPAPVTLADVEPLKVETLRAALIALAESVLIGDDKHEAVRGLLRREPPRLRSGVLGESIDELISATLGLDHSVLPVQGPPGTGKTFRGARMIVAALKQGLRVGVTAQSHAAIQNMLRDIEEHAHKIGYQVNGVYKGYPYDSPRAMIEWIEDNDDVEPDHNLVAGTAWLFARPEHRGKFHLLFVDEAGQFALANAAAAGLAA
jgi:uncharacterized protein